jgi:hypothetical protein
MFEGRLFGYLTLHYAVAVGVIGTLSGFLFGFGLHTLVSTEVTALGIAATIAGVLGVSIHVVWLLIFLKNDRERPIPDGAEPVELIEE